jgi:transposase
MSTPQELTAAPALVYTQIPKQVSRKDFNRSIAPALKRPTKGPLPKLSLYKIFNYILYVLHTGLPWNQLKTNRKELPWSNVYKWPNRWAKDGSSQALFEASVIHLQTTDQLDGSILQGDGSNTVVKKGGLRSAIRAINTKKGKKNWRLWTITALSWGL